MKIVLEKIKKQILGQYKTVHAFCKENPDVKRSTVYQILAGKYSGDRDKQIKRIQGVLAGVEKKQGTHHSDLLALEVYNVLQKTKCAYCTKLKKSACPECWVQTEREAQALTDYLRSREVVV